MNKDKAQLSGYTSDCGRVRLYLGDCLEIASTLTDVDAVITDPPYGIGYQHGGVKRFPSGLIGGHRIKEKHLAKTQMIIGDDMPFKPGPWLAYSLVLFWGANHFAAELPKSGSWLAWDKHCNRGANDSFVDCEFAWCNQTVKRNIVRHLWKGLVCSKQGEGLANVNQFKRLHVSQKPVSVMQFSLDSAKVPAGATVLDPYMGSGTTGVPVSAQDAGL